MTTQVVWPIKRHSESIYSVNYHGLFNDAIRVEFLQEMCWDWYRWINHSWFTVDVYADEYKEIFEKYGLINVIDYTSNFRRTN
jgi:hypothetical protein